MANSELTPSRRSLRRGRVLVADDDADCRRLVSAVLAHDGYDVLAVADGSSLLELLAGSAEPSDAPDVIVSDVCMPGRSGLDVLASLHELGIQAPMVLMTAFPDHCSAAGARALGAAAVLEKPFEIDDLRMIVLNLSSRRAGADEPSSPHGETAT